MKSTNKVELVVTQSIPSYTTPLRTKDGVTTGGNTIAQFDNEVTFESESIQEMTAEKIGLWAICALEHYQSIAKLQKQSGFKMSKHVTLKFKVNNREGTGKIKFSLNADRMVALLKSTPLLLSKVFVAIPNAGNITNKQATQFVTALPQNVVLAKHIKEGEPVKPAEVIQSLEYTEVLNNESVLPDAVVTAQ